MKSRGRLCLWALAQLLIHQCAAQVNYSVYDHETWEKVSKVDNIFSARNGHVTLQFKDRVYLIGGRSAEIQTYNLEETERNADVWYTNDGVSWTKELLLAGDFEVQNRDVKAPGPIAPWYARFGHTVVAMDITGSSQDDIMVLAGGYTPQPSNDVWITLDGVTWEFVHYADWSGRAWHAAAVFNDSLFIVGGTPLNNEVWAGTITRDDSYPFKVWYGRSYLKTRWDIKWRNLAEMAAVPWAPRAGHKLAVQCKYAVGLNKTGHLDRQVMRENYRYPDTFSPFCLLYLLGGYGGFDDSYFYYDGIRSKNDVWYTEDGVNWTVATYAAPWKPRAFHDVVVWHDPVNMTQDITTAGRNSSPRIWLAGGAYMGTKDNNIVYVMKGYVDLWWSRDGAKWYRVDYETGSGSFLFSTDTWAKTYVQGDRYYAGKWGHQLQHFRSASVGDALFVIGGTHVGIGDMVQDVWRANSYVICDLGGTTCSGYEKGYCGPGLTGCLCYEPYYGEYCERKRVLASSIGRLATTALQYVAVLMVLVWLL